MRTTIDNAARLVIPGASRPPDNRLQPTARCDRSVIRSGLLYQALADVVVVTHVAFIVFALLGGLLALRWRWMPWAHLPAAGWGVAVEFFGWSCPLTPLENALRRASGSAGYAGGFIERHLVPILYPAELTREFQLFLAGVLLAVNLAAYLVVWRRRRAAAVRG